MTPEDGNDDTPPKGRKQKVMVAKDTKNDGAMSAEDEQADWDASGAGWETVGAEHGECIDWEDTPRFIGIYIGDDITSDKAGKEYNIHCFSRNGEKFFAWAAFQIDEALEDCNPGDLVRIEWRGKREIKDGAQTMNVFHVQRRSAS